MAAAVFLLVGAAASLTTFLVLFTRSPVEPDSALEVGGTSTQIITATVAPTTTTVSSTAIPSTVAPTTPSTTTTAPTATTTTATVPGTSTTADVSYSIATHGLHPSPPLPGSGGWFGSGCSPGSDTLPDGIWWGYVTDLSPSSVTFDLACLRWFDPRKTVGKAMVAGQSRTTTRGSGSFPFIRRLRLSASNGAARRLRSRTPNG